MNVALFVGGMWRGGVTTFVLSLGPILRDAGHAVALVACERGTWWPRLAEASLDGFLLPPGRWESAAHHARRLASHFVAHRDQVVLLNNGLGVQPAMLSIPRWPTEMAAVPILHNDLPRVYAHAQIASYAWNVAVAASPKVHTTAAALLPHKPIVSIPYGIRLPPQSQVATRSSWALPLRLLFVGGLLDAHKGILRLPRILSTCRQQKLPVRLTVIGEGRDRRRLELALAGERVMDQVDMLGAQPADAVYQAMQTHHVLLIPSNYEGLPLVSLEAQANGCVPVASRLPGIMDAAIQDDVTGCLAEVGNIRAFVECIASFTRPARWQAFSLAGMERAQRLFSIETMGKRYLELLEQIGAGQYPLATPRSATAPEARRLFAMRDYMPGALRRALGRLSRAWRRRSP